MENMALTNSCVIVIILLSFLAGAVAGSAKNMAPVAIRSLLSQLSGSDQIGKSYNFTHTYFADICFFLKPHFIVFVIKFCHYRCSLLFNL